MRYRTAENSHGDMSPSRKIPSRRCSGSITPLCESLSIARRQIDHLARARRHHRDDLVAVQLLDGRNLDFDGAVVERRQLASRWNGQRPPEQITGKAVFSANIPASKCSVPIYAVSNDFAVAHACPRASPALLENLIII